MTGKPTAETDSKEVVMFGNSNLLNLSAVNVGKYGRKIGHILWTDDEIMSHMISPKKTSGDNCRPSFDDERKKIWEGLSTIA